MTTKPDAQSNYLNDQQLEDVSGGFHIEIEDLAVSQRKPKRPGETQIFDWYGDD